MELDTVLSNDPPAKWTGRDLRRWALRLAREIDYGKVTLTVDADRDGREHTTYHLNVDRRRRPGRDSGPGFN